MRKTFQRYLPIAVVLFTAFSLRFLNLGYSDYQGDEIKALLRPEAGSSVFEFLMDQRKGPLQFLVTGVMGWILGSYDNYFWMRFPFALSGSLTVLFFYLLIRDVFSKKTAFFSAMFIGINGFFVGLTRIVQYQGFVMMFAVLALWFFFQAGKSQKWAKKSIIFGFISWALSILFHYDGIFISPFAFYLLYTWWQNKESGPDRKAKIRIILTALLISGTLLGAFYVPFIFSLSDSTLDYWTTRISGEGRISSTKYLFNVYQPFLALKLYIVLPVIFVISGLIKFLTVQKKSAKPMLTYAAVLLWLVFPLLFMEVFVSIPGTHVTNYLMPLAVIMGLAISFSDGIISKWLKTHTPFYLTGFIWISCLIFLYFQSYAIFVDHKVEYPWRNERFLNWEMEKPDNDFYLSIFGFPYNRHWKSMREALNVLAETNNFYDTNERSTITSYYVPMNKKAAQATVLIEIINPQSFDTFKLKDSQKERAQVFKEYYSDTGELLGRIYLYNRD